MQTSDNFFTGEWQAKKGGVRAFILFPRPSTIEWSLSEGGCIRNR